MNRLRIKEAVKESGMTITEVCRKMQVSRSTFYGFAEGNPSFETLRKIADALGCSIFNLIEDDGKTHVRTIVQRTPVVVCPRCGEEIELRIVGSVPASVSEDAESTVTEQH